MQPRSQTAIPLGEDDFHLLQIDATLLSKCLCTCTVRLLFIPRGYIIGMRKKGVLPEVVGAEWGRGRGDSTKNISHWALLVPNLRLQAY